MSKSTPTLSVNEAAEQLGITGRAVRWHVAQGHLSAVRIGERTLVISLAALEKFRKNFPDDRAKRGPKTESA